MFSTVELFRFVSDVSLHLSIKYDCVHMLHVTHSFSTGTSGTPGREQPDLKETPPTPPLSSLSVSRDIWMNGSSRSLKDKEELGTIWV
jgi:hypothetical protein